MRVTLADGADVEVDPPTREGPVVLLLHGVGSSRAYLAEAVEPPLADAGWAVARADLRGHGTASPVTDPAAHALERQSVDVAVLAAAVSAEAVVGVSMGGHAAVAAAARGLLPGVRRVVAALPAWTGRAVPGEGAHAAVAAEVRAVGVEGMFGRIAGESEHLRPWLRRVLLRDLVSHDPASLAAALRALDGGLAPTRVELASLAVPLGVVGWPDDPGHPLDVAREWASAVPDGRLATLTLDAPDADRAALGRAVLEVLGPVSTPA